MNGLADRRKLVPKYHRPPGSDVVDVFVSVDVEKIRALTSLKHDWITTDGPKSAGGTVDTARHQSFGACELGARVVMS